MQSLKLPAGVPGRQMDLLFEGSRLDGLGPRAEQDHLDSGSGPHAGGGRPRRGA